MKNLCGLAVVVVGVIVASMTFGTFGQEPAPSGNLFIYSGTLRSMDRQARTIIVEASAVSQKFVVPTDAAIVVKDKPQGGELTDLMIGDGIQVKYTQDDDGALVAHQISLLGLKSP